MKSHRAQRAFVSRRRSIGNVSLALAATLVGSGCGEAPTESVEDVGIAKDAVTTVDYQDGSGTILLRVKTCDWTASAANNCAYCFVDPGWARVGGGAEIEGEATPGAMLKASYPYQGSFTTPNAEGCTGQAGPDDWNAFWVARSSGPAHRLRTYVIGMRLRNSPTDPAFQPFVTQGVDRVSNTVFPPGEFSRDCYESGDPEQLWENFWMIGGGAEIIPNDRDTGDALLTASYPVKAADGYTNIWRARGRVTQNPNGDAGLKCYGIGIELCPTGWNYCFNHPHIRSATGTSTSGYRTVTDTTPASWLPTSVGGLAQYGGTGNGRYLADLIPLNGGNKGFTVRTRSSNVGTPSSGQTFGYDLVVGQFNAHYTFNAIRFNTPGTALQRPSGTAPVSLRWSTGSPGTDPVANVTPHRFHLENLGGGQYRVRNGNPDFGTECARRNGTSVQVTTCATGNDFRWTIQTDPNGTFKLKSVSAGTCMDNNNGTSPQNVVLKTCIAAYSDVQSLFLDRYVWPPE